MMNEDEHMIDRSGDQPAAARAGAAASCSAKRSTNAAELHLRDLFVRDQPGTDNDVAQLQVEDVVAREWTAELRVADRSRQLQTGIRHGDCRAQG